ncbi:MAG: hypothetical protein K2O59_06745 [Lachnospiraceae bacterium]|nr:hypothetical protein [Lachnospiraceae bacterium]
MIRLIETNENDLNLLSRGTDCFDGNTQSEYLLLDETIWKKAREYFLKNINSDPIPVVNTKQEIVCYAWLDKEARREVRMLWELAKCDDAIGFRDVYPEYTGVTIHGCNELACYMAEYLINEGIPVRVDGKYWQEMGMKVGSDIVPSDCNYEIWAEGVHQKSRNWKQERLRSSSVEFECIDEIYEANIKAGKITDADGNVQALLDRLRKEKQIIIRGIGTMAQDAYDWLLSNGLDICAFQTEKKSNGRKSLFGKPILRKAEVEEQYKQAVLLEGASKHSAWGFGDVNLYAYGGYERNVRYLLLRDYLEVPENNLMNIFQGKNLVLTGDIRLCNRAYRWWKANGEGIGEIKFWDILGENESEKTKFQIPMENKEGVSENNIYLVLMPEYAYNKYLTEEALEKKASIIEKLGEHGIFDYTDYFSDMMKCIHLQSETPTYRKELRPKGILLGAIPTYCGNILFRQILDSHPQIVKMEDIGLMEVPFLSLDLYNICIRLAEEESKNILADFWTLYQREARPQRIENDFPDIEKFNKEMEKFLSLSTHFTSQELFVMFHLANNVMFGKELNDIDSMIIYWEPHMSDRKYVREWAYWLGSDDVKGFTVSMVRNRYIWAGSIMRYIRNPDYLTIIYGICSQPCCIESKNTYKNWSHCMIKFEDLKCYPKEKLTELCEWLGIPFNDILMETTFHGEKAYNIDGKITGFDIKPAYNLYEEYFSAFDRMRICIFAGSYQKHYGYPYVNCMQFSRRELQEMFLKEFRWEKLQMGKGKDEENVLYMVGRFRYLLWLERFSEITGTDIIEEF